MHIHFKANIIGNLFIILTILNLPTYKSKMCEIQFFKNFKKGSIILKIFKISDKIFLFYYINIKGYLLVLLLKYY